MKLGENKKGCMTAMYRETPIYSIDEVQGYVNQIFDMQLKLQRKDNRIAALEFELATQKEIIKNLQHTYLHISSCVY